MKTYTLEEIKELESKATKGPWFSGTQKTTKCLSGEMALVDARGYNIYEKCTAKENEGVALDNAKFIAASRTIVPQLVGQLEKAIKTFKDIRDFGLGKFKGTLDAKLAHSILMADLTLKELGVE